MIQGNTVGGVGLERTYIIEDEVGNTVTVSKGNPEAATKKIVIEDALLGEPYEGSTNVTPSATEEQQLSTTGKCLTEDITVEKIPYAEVSNPAGGVTVIIG